MREERIESLSRNIRELTAKVIFLICVPLLATYIMLDERDEIKELFYAKKSLICEFSKSKIEINIDDNWKIEENKFIKNSSSIQILKCKEK